MAQNTASSSSSYLIIGAGVFGVSTALHLKRKYPEARVALVDRDEWDADDQDNLGGGKTGGGGGTGRSRAAASWDWNKVVRADYDDIIYCRLGLEALDVFTRDPLWRPHYHATGIFWLSRSGGDDDNNNNNNDNNININEDDYARRVLDNYRALLATTTTTDTDGMNGHAKSLLLPRVVPVPQAREMYGGLFRHADYTGVSSVLVNPHGGWVAAAACLRSVTAAAVALGVRYLVADVAGLDITNTTTNKRCTGVITADGRRLHASHVLLCTGADTPRLLEIAAAQTGLDALSAQGRIVAGGITTGMTRLRGGRGDGKEDEAAAFAQMPVGVQWYATNAPFIGSLPPTADRELKWWGQTIFRNTKEVVPGSGRSISMPPRGDDGAAGFVQYNQWAVPARLQADIRHASRVFYGEASKSWKLEKFRICWDAFTTSSDFIISPHAAVDGLFLATCGSFHGYKFFPVLGKYVVQMLDGELAPELREKWAWDRDRPDPSRNPDWPRVEMDDYLDKDSDDDDNAAVAVTVAAKL